ncbi:carbohydrate ABC transporter permease [Rugosimonospora africana]|uniref:Sugar ABC transporter permease n=1 Tax=Rugosimonospora africana TaxID=556532 RepID=A0A8J3QQY2_9ACTN|nr:sugar ABC transporter permease [Rugosimonospora africana]GIH14911.1 sugar ABC transporter permease [Rugosimonospora africana]
MLSKSRGAVPRRGTRTGPVAGRNRRGTGAALVLMAPFFVLFALATLAPIGYAIYLSLFAQRASGLGFGGTRTVWVGLDNYVRVLTDGGYTSSYLHIAVYALVAVPLVLGLSVAVALLLDSAYAFGRRAAQLGLFVPHLVPGVIAALLWAYLYTPQVSPVVSALNRLSVHVNLLGHTFSYPTLVNVVLWESLGYNIVIYYASLQAIPREMTEAAVVDGSGEWRTAWHIKLPLIRSAVALTAIFSAIGAMQLFAEPLLLSDAGAVGITPTWTPNLYAYSAAFTRSNNYGVAAAAALLLAAFAAVLSFLVSRWAKPWQQT